MRAAARGDLEVAIDGARIGEAGGVACRRRRNGLFSHGGCLLAGLRGPARAGSSACAGVRGPVLVCGADGAPAYARGRSPGRCLAMVLVRVASRSACGLRASYRREGGAGVCCSTVRRHLERSIVARKWPFHAANRIPVICERIYREREVTPMPRTGGGCGGRCTGVPDPPRMWRRLRRTPGCPSARGPGSGRGYRACPRRC